jgi:outer membrane protein assembly factor BamB
MYCLDAKSGQIRWQFASGGPITGTVVVNDDVIFFGSLDKKVYALLA